MAAPRDLEQDRLLGNAENENHLQGDSPRSREGFTGDDKKYHNCLYIIKIFFGCLLSCLLLACLVSSKLSTLFMTSQINWNVRFGHHNTTEGNVSTCGVPQCLSADSEKSRQEEVIPWLWALFVSQTSPYGFTFLYCSWKILFKQKDWPKPSIWIPVLVIEFFHSFGTGLFFFCLLPFHDVFRGLFLLNGLMFVPGFLLIFDRPEKQAEGCCENLWHKCLKSLFYLLATIGQLSILVVWLVFDAMQKPLNDYCNDTIPGSKGTAFHNYTMFNNNLSGTATTHFEVLADVLPAYGLTSDEHHENLSDNLKVNKESFYSLRLWSLILAPLLISVGYWENFVDNNTKLGCLASKMQEFRQDFNRCKTKTYLIISLYKIGLAFGFVLLYYWISLRQDPLHLLHNNFNFDRKWAYVAVFNVVVGLISVLSAVVIIKGHMQLCCFTIPLFLSTPVAFGVLTLVCLKCKEWNTWGLLERYNCYGGYDSWTEVIKKEHSYIGFGLWFSEIFIGIFLLDSRIEKLAKVKKIFIRPMHCGLSLGQSLMSMRRRNDKEFSDRDLQERFPKNVEASSRQNHGGQNNGGQDHNENHGGQNNGGQDHNENHGGQNNGGQDHNENHGGQNNGGQDHNDHPKVYTCVTMWHEDPREMETVLKSLLRLNKAQNKETKFKFEAHIFFDDAFTPYTNPGDDFEMNEYVNNFMKTMAKTWTGGEGNHSQLRQFSETPYGGKLTWGFPSGNNKLFVHLKDKKRIRNKKRWSQVMYMRFLLKHDILSQEVADRTFILALDGDIDFEPEAVNLLLDLMERDVKVAASCGRIHPRGSGIMVWYQMFEYSLSHWLQKATEHVLGCTLCCPGCFSMYRASALIDVLDCYSKQAETPSEHIQYDQGEDRWLCTLLLQQGYMLEYCAAADAYTHAPTGFDEFFKQRRRWITSTFANLLDLQKNADKTIKDNEDISRIYIIYQGFLFFISILTPGTICMLIAGAIEETLNISYTLSLFVSLVPLLAFMVACFKLQNKTQLSMALFLSTGYAFLQMFVVVGLIRQIVEDGVCSPLPIFFLCCVGTFVFAALLHPKEFGTLIHGFLFFLLIPSMYQILTIYSVCNVHIVSWGTRETSPIKSEKESMGKGSTETGASQIIGWRTTQLCRETNCHIGNLCQLTCCMSQEYSHDQTRNESSTDNHDLDSTSDRDSTTGRNIDIQIASTSNSGSNAADGAPPNQGSENEDQASKAWTKHELLKQSEECALKQSEKEFWKSTKKEYLAPSKTDDLDQKSLDLPLRRLRNKSVFLFSCINLLLMVLAFGYSMTISLDSNMAVSWQCTVKGQVKHSQLHPIALCFILLLGVILAIQILGMLYHRFFTFVQIMSNTKWKETQCHHACCQRQASENTERNQPRSFQV